MARRDAKDVEREYYEYRRKMQEKRQQASQKAAAQRAQSEAPLGEAAKQAADLADQGADIAAKAASLTNTAADEIAQAGVSGVEDVETAVDEAADEFDDFEDDSGDGAENDEQGGGILRGVGSRISALGGTLGGLFKSIGRRKPKTDEEGPDETGADDDSETGSDADEDGSETAVVPDGEDFGDENAENGLAADEPAGDEPIETPAFDETPRQPEPLPDDNGAAADIDEAVAAPLPDEPEPVDSASDVPEQAPVEEVIFDGDTPPENGVIRSESVPIDLNVDEDAPPAFPDESDGSDGEAADGTATEESAKTPDIGDESEEALESQEEDGDEGEKEGTSFLGGLFGRLQALISRRKAESDDDSDEDSAASGEADGDAEAGEAQDEQPEESEGVENAPAAEASNDMVNDAHGATDMEGDYKTMDNNRKSMTETMAEGLSETPTLSRRERRMLAEAANASAAAKEKVEDDLDRLSDAIVEDEQPTVEYKPVRSKAKKPVVMLDEEDDEDEDEDDEEEEEEEKEAPKAKKPSRPEKKRPVYDDDEDDDDEDDEDDEDYDDEDDDDEISAGKRIFGVIKVLLAIFLLLALVALALRVAEAGGYINLDWVRANIGTRINFINTLFPAPNTAIAG